MNRFRRTRHEIAKTAKAPADPAVNISPDCSSLDLNNKGTERMRAAPLKPNPNINIANNLFIETPLTLRVRTMETFHYLEDEEEISLFDTINTKAKGIGSSLSRYLKRDSEDLSWVAAQLIIQPDSPFHD